MEFIRWQIKFFSELTSIELYQIVKLRQDVFMLEQDCLYGDLDNLDQKALHATLISEEDDQVIAYCRILPVGLVNQEVTIGRVVVCEASRNKGHATNIMKRVLQFINDEMQVLEVKISAQKYLQSFYEKLDFKTVSAPYNEDGIEHISMLLTNEELFY